MTISTALRLVASVTVVVAVMEYPSAAKPPDPVVLVQGVISSRLQLSPFYMEMQLESQDAFGSRSARFAVECDGERRRFRDGEQGGSVIFDGRWMLSYDAGTRTAEKRLEQDFGRCAFDPRTLGINHYFLASTTVPNALPVEDGGRAVLVGQDTIGTNAAWHVQISPPPTWGVPEGYVVDVWIDEEFRVHRYVQNGVDVRSFYERADIPSLPSKVIVTCSLTKKQTKCMVRNARLLKKKPSEDTWTLAGLELPRGTPVHDLSTRTRIGYWDGSQIVATVREVHSTPPVSPWVALPAVTLVFAAPLFGYVLRRRKEKANE